MYPIVLKNIQVLKSLCVVVPAGLMVAAHWFPWRQVLGRELDVKECYAIGTAIMFGTSMAVMSLSEGDKDDHIVMVALTCAAGGVATLAAYEIDDRMETRAKLADANARLEALNIYHGNL
jgi:hypothetical protein